MYANQLPPTTVPTVPAAMVAAPAAMEVPPREPRPAKAIIRPSPRTPSKAKGQGYGRSKRLYSGLVDMRMPLVRMRPVVVYFVGVSLVMVRFVRVCPVMGCSVVVRSVVVSPVVVSPVMVRSVVVCLVGVVFCMMPLVMGVCVRLFVHVSSKAPFLMRYSSLWFLCRKGAAVVVYYSQRSNKETIYAAPHPRPRHQRKNIGPV